MGFLLYLTADFLSPPSRCRDPVNAHAARDRGDARRPERVRCRARVRLSLIATLGTMSVIVVYLRLCARAGDHIEPPSSLDEDRPAPGGEARRGSAVGRDRIDRRRLWLCFLAFIPWEGACTPGGSNAPASAFFGLMNARIGSRHNLLGGVLRGASLLPHAARVGTVTVVPPPAGS